jgi:hypothetical protein
MGPWLWHVPPPALLASAADGGGFAAQGGQDVGVAGVGIARVVVQPPARTVWFR